MAYPIGEDHFRTSIAVSFQCHGHHAAQRGLKRDVPGRSSLGGANLTHHTSREAKTGRTFSIIDTVRVNAVG